MNPSEKIAFWKIDIIRLGKSCEIGDVITSVIVRSEGLEVIPDSEVTAIAASAILLLEPVYRIKVFGEKVTLLEVISEDNIPGRRNRHNAHLEWWIVPTVQS